MLHGAIKVAGPAGTNSLLIGMFVSNAGVKGWSYDVAVENLSILGRIVYQGTTVSYIANDGSKRTAQILKAEMSQPEFIGIKGAKVTISLVTQPFWYADAPIVSQQTMKNGVIQFQQFEGSTAPILDAKITVTGGKTVTLTSPENGTGIIIPGTASPDRPFIVDLEKKTVTQAGANIEYDYPPAGLLEIEPTLAAGARKTTIKLQGKTAVGQPAGTIKLEGKKWYL